MVIAFSGTGNSYYVGNLLAELIGERLVPLVELPPLEAEYDGESLGFVFPIYSWGVPPIVLNYIRNLNERFIEEANKHPVWLVMVCGDETGKAPDMFNRVLKKRGLELSAGWSIQAPNNYVILPGFNIDSPELEKEKLDKIPEACFEIAGKIKRGERVFDFVEGPMAGIKTRLVYPLFKRWGIFPSRWQYTDACVSCGKCAKACPVGNIAMTPDKASGKSFPKWGSNCESCLACYHVCPRNAVQYGSATRKKGQYWHGPNR